MRSMENNHNMEIDETFSRFLHIADLQTLLGDLVIMTFAFLLEL